jgi:hypothetical protein
MHVERLKAYTPEDAAGIGRLMPYLSKSFDGEPVNEQLLRTIIESDSHEQLVARIDARIIGAATLSIILGAGAGKKGWLEDFVTDPEAGVKGTGQIIWDEMGKWCLEHDVNLNFTSRPSREAAHNFYLKNGASVRETTVFQADFK